MLNVAGRSVFMKLGSLNLRSVELSVGVGEVEMDLRGIGQIRLVAE